MNILRILILPILSIIHYLQGLLSYVCEVKYLKERKKSKEHTTENQAKEQDKLDKSVRKFNGATK